MDKLNELQKKRSELAAEMRKLADRQATWAAEDRAKWDELNKLYDANLALLNEEKQKVQAQEAERKAIHDRVTQIETYQDVPAATNGNDWRKLLGRDGASLMNGPRALAFFRSPEARAEFNKLQVLALQAWMLAGRAENHSLITDEQVNAAKALGVNLSANEVKLRIGDTAHFRKAQSYYTGGARLARNGSEALNGRDFWNDMQAGKGSTGGFLIGETLLARLEQALLDYSGVLQVAEVLRTDNGETLRWPVMDDTGNQGARVGEGQDAGIGTSTDPKVGRLNLQAFIYHSNFLNVSRALMTDSAINLEDMFGGMMGVRLGRKQNVDFTTGADVGNGPIGLVIAAALGKTATSATALLFDDVIDLEHSIDPARRRQPGNGYMMHDSIVQVVRKLKDGVGQYLWSNGTQAMAPDQINGRSFFINQAMDSTVASGKKTMLFGELPMYKVRQVNEILLQRLIERRAEFYEDVFISYMRADGGLLIPGNNDVPVKYLQH